MNKDISDALIIGYDYTAEKDNTVLIVGRKKKGGPVDIINAFSGQEAKDIYEKLTGVKQQDELVQAFADALFGKEKANEY